MGNSNNKAKQGIAQFIVNYKITIGIITCIIYVGVIDFPLWFNKSGDNMLEATYYVSQITSGFFVVMGTAIAVIQYISNSNIARKEADKQRKIEAAKMANEFKEKVLPLINDVSIGYSDESLKKEVIDYLDSSKLELFNREELLKLFPEDICFKYQVRIARNYLLRTDKKFVELDQRFKNTTSVDERALLEKEVNEYVFRGIKKVNAITTDLSNSLEYMCICFNTNIADDETVYQSLHNAFFLAVHMIYIWTFGVNINEHDRLFYNVMILYKKWKRLNYEKKQEEEKSRIMLEEKMNSLKIQHNDSIAVRTRCE